MKAKQSKKKVVDRFVRATPTTAEQIRKIAKQIFDQWPDNCHNAGYHRPSSKMAIDFLLCAASECGPFKVDKLSTKNNIYLAIERLHKEEE